jgi:predicted dehydrogenase
MSEESRLRLGILGAARIARSFVTGVQASPRLRVVAVASRELARAQQFAHEFQVARAYGSYESLLADPGIDAIYNPLPNSLHARWSIHALEAGKHVLCEKPLGLNATQVRSMFQAARQHGRHLVEGFPYRSQPLTQRLQELVAAQAIGRLQLIQAHFGFRLQDEANIRLDASLGGGALWDVGCYPVSLIRMLSAQRPRQVQALAHWSSQGVDRSLVASLRFESGLLAQIGCSFATAADRQAVILGDAGVIETQFENHPAPGRAASLRLKRGLGWDAASESIEAPSMNGFLAEAESFCALIRGSGPWTGVSEQESVDIAMTLDAIHRSARSGSVVDVDD